MLLSVGPGRGRKGLENRPCMTVIIATLSPRPKEGDPATPTTATTTTATARANSLTQKRKRPLEDDSQRSPVSLSRPPETQGFSLDLEDDGYVDLVSGLDASPTSFIESLDGTQDGIMGNGIYLEGLDYVSSGIWPLLRILGC